jgi:hypothetical protein
MNPETKKLLESSDKDDVLKGMLRTLTRERDQFPHPPIKSYTQRFDAGLMIRKTVENEIRSFLDMHGCSYRLQAYPNFFSTTFNLRMDITNWDDLENAYTVLRMIHRNATTREG